MNSTGAIPLTVLLATGLAAAAGGPADDPGATAAPTLDAQSLETRVDAYVAPYVETDNFSGAVLIARHGEVLLAKGYGLASRELGVPSTPETVYHLASVSKPFTAAAILLLADQGKLAVSDPVGRFVPSFPHPEITLHQLLVHSSGLPDVNRLPVYAELSLHPQTPASLVAAFQDEPLDFPPGSRYGYSNSNYNLLALVVEKVSGQSYGEFLEEAVFRPLGMRSSGHHGDAAAIIPGAVSGYSPAGLGLAAAPWLDWSVKTGNGSLYSTVGDLLRFERALHDGRLLSAASRRAMFTDHLDGAGYGWFLRRVHDRAEIHINGRSPGFGSHLGTYPEEDLTIILLGNIYNSVATLMADDIAAILLGEPYAVPTMARRRLPADELARIVGDYRFGDDFYAPGWTAAVRAKDGFLFNEGDWLIPVSGARFLHRRYWSDIEFLEPDEAGHYQTVRFDEYTGQRVAAAEPAPPDGP